MANFYSNENFPIPIVLELRKLGHDVLTIQETGKSGVAFPDEEVLAYCISKKRILLTLNRRDFIRLHNKDSNHSGIFICTFDLNFSALAKRIDSAANDNNTFNGKLIRINRLN